MIGLVGVELLKLRTTRRSLYGWVAAVVALVGLGATGAAFTPVESADAPTLVDVVSVAWLAAILGLLYGIISATNEWRHGTASVTFLVTPARWPVVLAKLVSSALAGVALTALAVALAGFVGAAVLSGRDLPVDTGTATWIEIAQILAAAAMAGALGSAIGSVVQAQVPALIVTIGWFLVAEPTIGLLVDLADVGGVSDYLPASAFTAIDGSSDIGQALGTAVALTYLAVFAVAGVERTRRRDIT